jgi:hypothetical protein
MERASDHGRPWHSTDTITALLAVLAFAAWMAIGG